MRSWCGKWVLFLACVSFWPAFSKSVLEDCGAFLTLVKENELGSPNNGHFFWHGFEYSFDPNVAAHRDLRRRFETLEATDPRGIAAFFNRWSRRNRIGWKFEVVPPASRSAPVRTRILPPALWKKQLSRRKLLMSHAHDFTDHAPQTGILSQAEGMRELGQFYSDCCSKGGGYQDFRKSLADFMDKQVRELVTESLIYVANPKGKRPRLVVMGGATERIIFPTLAIGRWFSTKRHGSPPRGITPEDLHLGTATGVFSFGKSHFDFSQLIGFKKFTEAQPGRWKRMEKELRALGMLQPEYDALHSKLTAVAAEANANLDVFGSQRVEHVFGHLAQGIVKDPQLAAAFEKKRRTTLLRKLVRYLKAYEQWVESNYK